MVTKQRTKLYTREIRTQLVKDQKPVANTEPHKLDHMLRIQVRWAAVSIKKALWARTQWIDSMSMLKLNQLIKFKVWDHKLLKYHQEFPRPEAPWNLKFPKRRNKRLKPIMHLWINKTRKKSIKSELLSITSQRINQLSKKNRLNMKRNNMMQLMRFQNQMIQLHKCRDQPNQNWAKCPVKHTFLNFKNN